MRYLVLLAASIGAMAESGTTVGEISDGGVTLRFELRASPDRSQTTARLGSGSLRDGGVTKQYFYDTVNREYFGYDLRLEVTADGRCRMTVKPLTLTAEDVARESHGKFPSTGKAVEIKGAGVYEGREGEEISVQLRSLKGSPNLLVQKTLLQRCSAEK